MHHLQRSLMFGLSLLMSIGAIAGGVGFSYKTVDDSDVFYQYLNQTNIQSGGQVLGANSEYKEKQELCPENTPIVGWIDFRGKKIIKNDLPSDQIPSACFENVETANSAGYILGNY